MKQKGGKVMAERETLTVRETAKILGIAPQAVREQMKAGVLPIGDCWENSKGTGYRFRIFKDKLDRHMGKTPEMDAQQLADALEAILRKLQPTGA